MNTAAEPPASSPAASPDRRRLPGWMRWLHIHVSMLGLGTLLFFSVTGLTLNHPDWTLGGQRREHQLKGQLNAAWLAADAGEKSVEKLAVVEELRRVHGLHGQVDDFRVDDTECSVAFKGPGSSADVVINRRTGAYQLTLATEGFVALVNDLHKGRHTGPVWAWAIDLTAGLLTLVAITGLWLLFYVRRRRTSGLWVGLAGALLLWLVFLLGVR